MTIGILDSGLGGYSVYHALRAAYPDAAFLFLADQANAPFGDKTKAEIFDIACDAVEWFKAQNINEILVACNTISALVLDELIPLYPDMKITGIIEPTIKQIKAKHEKILVAATQGTINSHASPDKIKSLIPGSTGIGIALPQLVIQLEGLAPKYEIENYLMESLSHYVGDVQAVILACTHYPLMRYEFEKILKVKVYDSEKPIIDLFKNRILDQGPSRVMTTKDPAFMGKQISVLFNTDETVELAKVNHADRRHQ